MEPLFWADDQSFVFTFALNKKFILIRFKHVLIFCCVVICSFIDFANFLALVPAAKEQVPVQEHKEEKVLDGKDGGAVKDGDGDKMEGEWLIHHNTESRTNRTALKMMCPGLSDVRWLSSVLFKVQSLPLSSYPLISWLED